MNVGRTILLLILAALGLFAFAGTWLWSTEFRALRPQFERLITMQIGRPFSIDGDFSIAPGRHSVIVAEAIRAGNPAWAASPDLLRVRRLEVHVDTLSLLRGPIVIGKIALDGVEIELQVDADDRRSWATDGNGAESMAASDVRDPDVLIELVDVDGLHLVYRDAARPQPFDLQIGRIRQERRPDGYLELQLDGTLDGRQLTLRGDVGDRSAMLAGRQVHYSVDGRLGGIRFTSKGLIDDIGAPRRPAFEFSLQGPDIDELTLLLGIGDDGVGALDLTGSVTPRDDGPVLVSVAGRIGRAQIEGQGAFSDLQALDSTDIDLRASGPDLGYMLRLFGVEPALEAAFELDVRARRRGRELVVDRAQLVAGDARFDMTARLTNFPDLNDARISIDVEGSDLQRFRSLFRLPGVATGDFSLAFELDVGPAGAEIAELDLRTALGTLVARGELGAAPDYFDSTLEFSFHNDDLRLVGDALGVPNLPRQGIDITGRARLTPAGVQLLEPLALTSELVEASIEGLVKPADGAIGSDLRFAVEGPDLAGLAAAFGTDDSVPSQPFRLSGALRIEDSRYRVDGATGTVGTSAVTIDGQFARPDLRGSSFNVTAEGPAFEELAPVGFALAPQPGPYRLSGTLASTPDMLNVENLELHRERGDLTLDLDLRLPVSRRQAAFRLSGAGADIRSMLPANDAFEISAQPFSTAVRGSLDGTRVSLDRFELRVGDASSRAEGSIELADAETSMQLQFSGDIPDLSAIGRFGGRQFRSQRSAWSARVTSGGNRIRIEELNAQLGASDLQGSIGIRHHDHPELTLDLQSSMLVLESPLEPLPASTQAPPADGRVIPDVKLPFDAMESFDATVRLTVGQLVRRERRFGDVHAEATLRAGALDVSRFSLVEGEGRLNARARLARRDGRGDAMLSLAARDMSLVARSAPDLTPIAGDVDIELTARGDDLRALLGGASGAVLLDLHGGRVVNDQFLSALYGDLFEEVLGKINPFLESDPYTNLECIVAAYEIDDGIASAAPITLISTDKIQMVTKSSVDLSTEEISVLIHTAPRKTLTLSAAEVLNPYMKIVGTMAAPRFAVDEKGALISGGAAFATGGLSILAKAAWDRFSRPGDPCANAAERARAQLARRLPGLQPH